MRQRKPRMAPLASEKKEQMALIEWAQLRHIPLVHHTNEGKRSKREGAILKLMGMSPGYPDLSLSKAHGGYFGLFIELKQNREYTKSEMNTPSWRAQSAWLTELANEHYYALRCFGWEHAKNIVEMYLKWPKTFFHPNHSKYDVSSL